MISYFLGVQLILSLLSDLGKLLVHQVAVSGLPFAIDSCIYTTRFFR